MRLILAGLVTHALAVAAGFALGVYLLPILTAPPPPPAALLARMGEGALYEAELALDLPGHDFLHWGEGTVRLTGTQVVHEGRLAPGPDYRLYLVPSFVDHEDAFLPLKAESLEVGPVDGFSGFVLDLPAGTDLEAYDTVLIWCEAFSEFIAAGRYR